MKVKASLTSIFQLRSIQITWSGVCFDLTLIAYLRWIQFQIRSKLLKKSGNKLLKQKNSTKILCRSLIEYPLNIETNNIAFEVKILRGLKKNVFRWLGG